MWIIEKIVKKGDYNYAVVRNHPRATKYGYVLHHRVVMENHLGRLLEPNEIVHHKNHDRKNNRIENLEILTNSEHARLHGHIHGRKWVELKCPNCKVIFHREKRSTHLCKPSNYTCCSRSCNGKFSNKQDKNSIDSNVVREYIKRYAPEAEQD